MNFLFAIGVTSIDSSGLGMFHEVRMIMSQKGIKVNLWSTFLKHYFMHIIYFYMFFSVYLFADGFGKSETGSCW